MPRSRFGLGRLAIGCLLACACGPATPATSTAPSSTTIVVAPALSASPAPASLPPPVAPLAEVLCSFETSRSRPVPLLGSLRLSPTGAAFAAVFDAPARVDVGSRQAFVAAERSGVRLSGIVDLAEWTFHARAGRSVGGVLTLKPEANLRWVGPSTEGRIALAYELADGTDAERAPETYFGVISVPDHEFALECRDIALEPATSKASPPADRVLRRAMLRPKQSVLLTALPGDANGARLRSNPNNPDHVSVLEVRGRRSRVFVELHDATALGWVANEDLVPFRLPTPEDYGMIGVLNADNAPVDAPPTARACPKDLRLFARTKDDVAEVGMVRAGTAFELGTRDAELTPVTFPTLRWMMPVAGAALLVPTSSLVNCPRVKE